jgi:hypothetical protein
MKVGALFPLAAIATIRDRDFDPKRMVRLPHDPGARSGHPRTGLIAPSAVHVDFTHLLVVEQIAGASVLQVRCELRPLPNGRRQTVTPSELQAVFATYCAYWLAH